MLLLEIQQAQTLDKRTNECQHVLPPVLSLLGEEAGRWGRRGRGRGEELPFHPQRQDQAQAWLQPISPSSPAARPTPTQLHNLRLPFK